MSEFHRQQALQPTFIDVSANPSLSGRDAHDNEFDVTHLYHEPNYQALPDSVQMTLGYAHDEFAYASHSGNVSLPGLQYTVPTMSGQTISPQYEYESPLLVDMNGFSPIAPHYNVNAYRTPYPESNATASTSSAASPDPGSANLMNDPMIVEAEEDKRKRNQAASARFRQKKKQREQQLVESTREMQERTKKLEQENEGLRKENLFLKKLLVEKVDHMDDKDREMLQKAANGTLGVKK